MSLRCLDGRPKHANLVLSENIGRINEVTPDTVNHDILLSKLYTYGIRGTPFKWFKSYLRNRTQFVKIDEIESSMETITCGGSLGPLLFLLYIIDLPNSSEKLSFRIFADDTNIFFTGSNPKEIEFTMNLQLISYN